MASRHLRKSRFQLEKTAAVEKTTAGIAEPAYVNVTLLMFSGKSEVSEAATREHFINDLLYARLVV